ncbi:hypothetical protein [Inquilinus limosus]|uniref:hypothetical protein n=1 Tax=Inquilinus limosus TaxID=171674 RepID=UPI000405E2B6|nr:hypothetical protein [Inquilinus limosus]
MDSWGRHSRSPHREENIVILSARDLAAMIVDTNDGLSRETLKVLDLPGLTALLRNSTVAATLMRELGVTGSYYFREVSGETYVIFRGYPGQRTVLQGTRYLARNPLMLRFGISEPILGVAMRSNVIFNIVAYTTIEVLRFLVSDKQTLSRMLASVVTNVSIGLIATATAVLAASFVSGTVVIVAIGVPLAVGLAVGAAFGYAADALGVSERLAELMERTGRAVEDGLVAVGEMMDQSLLDGRIAAGIARGAERARQDALGRIGQGRLPGGGFGWPRW